MCSYVGPNILVLWCVREPFEIHHRNSHVGAWGLKHLLVSHHVKSVVEIVRDQLPLLFFFMRSPLSAIGVALLALLSLIISLPIEYWLIITNIEDQISSLGRKNWEARKTQGIWREIHIIVLVLEV